MANVKRSKSPTFKDKWGWVADSPPSIGLIFGMVLLIFGGSAAYLFEYGLIR